MLKHKTILVVDDNYVDCMLLCKIIERNEYTILHASNGEEALAILKGDQHIDLVLLDIVMPIMNGHELLKHMNESGLLAQSPVIIMTSNEDKELEIQCFQEGASDFLNKPYNAQVVRHRVDSILRLWDNALLVGRLETDYLTGIYNTESFFRHAQERLDEKLPDDWNLVYITIEDFELLRDRYGAEIGANILRYTAGIIKEWTGDEGICGRLAQGGFAMLHREPLNRSQEDLGRIFGEKFRNAPIKGLNIKCGVCRIADNSTMSIINLCERARLAEESIHHQYGVYAAFYNDSMRQAALREHQLTNYMEEALEQRQFVVYLQPKHSTETGKVAGAEALVRWIHPELGFISPGEFIPLFERNGFIVKLDYFVWEEVCRTLRSWLDTGIQPVPISVNASRADFLAVDLPEQVSNLIDKYDLSPDLLHVEVTESAYTDNPRQIIEAVSILRDIGFKIEMDDFGSGYSSLNMLSELPIDILKLDMQFMQQGTDRLKGSKRNILSFIVSLSKWLQLPTVAEGVESKEEFDLLKAMGCNLIQGYYFSKPMPIADFASYMRTYVNPIGQAVTSVRPARAAIKDLPSGEKRNILVIEDIESNREVILALLSHEYHVAEAVDGRQGYEYIKAHAKELSCILLDLLMPVMDGFQVLELLHDDPELSKIPVIITTESGSHSELRALNLGAHSFVSKPYDPDVLRHHVYKAVEEKELRERLVKLEARYEEEEVH